MNKKIKITHIITALGIGGAETALYRLLESTNRDLYDINVICLTEMGVYGEKMKRQLNIEVYICNVKSIFFLSSLVRCFLICRNSDIIQTWMYHSNLIGFLIAKFWRKKIIWGIHHSNLDRGENKRITITIAKVCSLLSKKVDAIVSCGKNVKEIHESIGYASEKHIVISNGINTDIFKPTQKRNYYKNLFLVKDKYIMLHVGRWDPLKDYQNLISSLKHLHKQRQDFQMFIVGAELDDNNFELTEMIKENNLENHIILLGGRKDIPQLMAAADLFILSSSGEGLPNVIVEAMASGTCCVATDVGDCKNVIGAFGETVSPKDSIALAQAINKVLDGDSHLNFVKAVQAREYIIANYNILNIVKQYEALYLMLLEKVYTKKVNVSNKEV